MKYKCLIALCMAAACGRSEFHVPLDPQDTGAVDGSADSTGQGDPPPMALSLVSGVDFSCAQRGGKLGCWGNAQVAEALGPSVRANGGAVVKIGAFTPAPAFSMSSLAASATRFCGVQNGKVLCTVPDEPATSTIDLCSLLLECGQRVQEVPMVAGAARSVSVSANHACILLDDRSVACWGRNDKGQLGHSPGTQGDGPCADGVGVCNQTPRPVAGLAAIEKIAVGGSAAEGTSCAIGTGGRLVCWGSNKFGQLGQGRVDNAIHGDPDLVLDGILQASVSGNGTCAIDLMGKALCWGDSKEGIELPGFIPRIVERLSDVSAGSSAPLNSIREISRGQHHACALDFDGRVWCWGRNDHGQLGRGREGAFDSVCNAGTALCSVAANRVESVADVQAISVGDFHSCAAKTDGSLLCWGSNSAGQAGTPIRQPSDAGNFTSASKVVGAGQ